MNLILIKQGSKIYILYINQKKKKEVNKNSLNNCLMLKYFI